MNTQYKYTIQLSYLNNKTSEKTDIPVENIASFIIDNDYVKSAMSKIFVKMFLDKNLIDDMIMNANDNLFNLVVNKFKVDDDQPTDVNRLEETLIYDQYTYFITGDINYRRDLDYPDVTTGNTDEKRSDILKPIMIALVRKKSIEDKLKSFNFVLTNTTMIDAVNLGIKHMTTVLEPLEYNKKLEQVIIPPLTSVEAYLKFLNKISVFYSTPFRFYIENDICFLISSSAKSIPRKGDAINSIIIEIANQKDISANKLGMEIDEEKGYGRVIIPANDSEYKINRVTEKKFTKISAVLDSSREKAKSIVSNIKNAISKATQCMSSVNDVVNQNKKKVNSKSSEIAASKSIIIFHQGQLDDNMGYIKEACGVIYAELEKALGVINFAEIQKKIDEYYGDPSNHDNDDNPSSSPIDLEEIRRQCESILNLGRTLISMGTYIDERRPIVKKLIDDYIETRQVAIDSMVGSISINSFVNGIEPINLLDNTHLIENNSKTVSSNINKTNYNIENVMKPMLSEFNTIKSKVASLISMLYGCQDEVIIIDEAAEINIVVDLTPIKEDYGKLLKSYQGYIVESTNAISGTTDPVKEAPKISSNVLSQTKEVIAMINSLKNMKIDLKSEFKTMGSKLSGIATSTTSQVKLPDLTKVQTHVPINKLHDLGSTNLNIGNISNITKNLDSIKDLSNIGGLGLTKLDTEVSMLGRSVTGMKDNFTFVRVPNDNPNMIKNIKANIENNTANLTINKNNIDTSLFTLNKEYVVRNFDSHSNRDGHFLLIKKKDVFLREAKEFTLNSIIDFTQTKN